MRSYLQHVLFLAHKEHKAIHNQPKLVFEMSARLFFPMLGLYVHIQMVSLPGCVATQVTFEGLDACMDHQVLLQVISSAEQLLAGGNWADEEAFRCLTETRWQTKRAVREDGGQHL